MRADKNLMKKEKYLPSSIPTPHPKKVEKIQAIILIHNMDIYLNL